MQSSCPLAQPEPSENRTSYIRSELSVPQKERERPRALPKECRGQLVSYTRVVTREGVTEGWRDGGGILEGLWTGRERQRWLKHNTVTPKASLTHNHWLSEPVGGAARNLKRLQTNSDIKTIQQQSMCCVRSRGPEARCSILKMEPNIKSP